MAQQLTTRSGLKLSIERDTSIGRVSVCLQNEVSGPVVLHWGLRRDGNPGWQVPPRPFWPEGTTAQPAQSAVRTSFPLDNGHRRIVIPIGQSSEFSSIEFALFFPEENRWDSNDSRNYRIEISDSPNPSTLHEAATSFERVYEIGGEGRIATTVTKDGGRYRVAIATSITGPLVLHWGVARHILQEWQLPAPSTQPPGTVVYQDSAARTPFVPGEHGMSQVLLEFPEPDAPMGVRFVVLQADKGRWIKDRGSDFFVPVSAVSGAGSRLQDRNLAQLADEIIRAETGRNSWTLMHRFNLCYDLLDRARGDEEAFALLFVWMRFSAIRQLDWQRNYNTKPRELSHAQDRLTSKLADVYLHDPTGRVFVRGMLASVGRGGEGQRIRDEILAIMHRHRIKEVSGHFMEEWHQKLHNNTTPDDVVICEAYLEFLRSNGNREAFYRTLEAGGVTKERMESFERPIRSAPDFVPYLKDGLIHDFESFLRTLRAVHSGTDLETAINTASYVLDDDARGLLWHLYHAQHDPHASPLELAGRATEARHRLAPRLTAAQGLRDLLYVDLAVEQYVRTVVERSLHLHLDGNQLVDLISILLDNIVLISGAPEFALIFPHWERLKSQPRFTREWSLHARAALDRIGHALGASIDWYRKALQGKAEYLGNGFRAAPWTITLFSEEVIRGTLASTLSMLVHHLHPVLRETAHLGNWQIISRGSGTGRVEVVKSLRSVQGNVFEEPVIIVADSVAGDEEIPEGTAALVISREIDVLSHVAVRARDAKVLFGICLDPQIFERLKSLHGQRLSLEVNSLGEVTFTEGSEQARRLLPQLPVAQSRIVTPEFVAYAIPESEFREKTVGGKSCNQARLRGRLPDWVHQPASVAVPFGVCERVLALDANRSVRDRYQSLISEIERNPVERLSELRRVIQELVAPDELRLALCKVMENAGLSWPQSWDQAWACIKRVWASKWNDRAWLSRNARRIMHDQLLMAVLIQQVIDAEYAFVIHTVNPATGDGDELYGEIVLGLGETLVGNYPGRALGFVCNRKTMQPELTAFPSKSIGLYGSGLIFRSDSNGEDLPGYAGAGLYDSFTLTPPREVVLDYSQERLMWDEDFRRNLLLSVAKAGFAIADAAGSPQDIEGAVSRGEYYVVQARAQAV